MHEQEPQSPRTTTKPESRDHIGSPGFMRDPDGNEIEITITERNSELFGFDKIEGRFTVSKQGTGLIVPSLESYTGQYSPSDEPRRSRRLAMFLTDGSFLEFFALDVRRDSEATNGGAHHHVVDIETIDNEGLRHETIDVNKIYSLGGALLPLTWHGDNT